MSSKESKKALLPEPPSMAPPPPPVSAVPPPFGDLEHNLDRGDEGVLGTAGFHLNSHCDEKIELVVEEEDGSADLEASSGSRGRPPANMASTLGISHR